MKQIAFIRNHDLIYDKLPEKRHDENEELQDNRQQEYSRQLAAQALDAREELRQRQPGSFAAFPKSRGRYQFQRHAGKTLRNLVEGHLTPARFRIDDLNPVPGRALHDDEVVHVPVQNDRTLEVLQVCDFEPKCSRGEVQAFAHFDQICETGAPCRRWPAPSQVGNVDRESIIARNHGHTGQTALRVFRLQDDRQPAAAQECTMELNMVHRSPNPFGLYGDGYMPFAIDTTGSKSHSMSVRSSRMMSACKSRPG